MLLFFLSHTHTNRIHQFIVFSSFFLVRNHHHWKNELHSDIKLGLYLTTGRNDSPLIAPFSNLYYELIDIFFSWSTKIHLILDHFLSKKEKVFRYTQKETAAIKIQVSFAMTATFSFSHLFWNVSFFCVFANEEEKNIIHQPTNEPRPTDYPHTYTYRISFFSRLSWIETQ